MHATKLLSFFLLRMILQGLVLGTVLGTIYGLVLGVATFPYGVVLIAVGALFGIIGGSFLGAVSGVGLFAITFVRRPRCELRYRSVCGLACAVAGVLTVIFSWEVAFRTGGMASLASQFTFERYLAETLVLVLIPALSAGCAMWWAGSRAVRGRDRRTREPRSYGRCRTNAGGAGRAEKMNTVGLLWGLLWRMVLSGFVFGALLVAAFGTALPGPTGMNRLGPCGELLVVFAGAFEGSSLGGVCGLLLFVTTRAFYFPVPDKVHDYLATAGATCALVGLTLSLVDWLLHGCPDPNNLAVWRALDMFGPVHTSWPAGTGILFGTGPLLAATLDMGLSGVLTASWYARETGERPISCAPFG
jgi:hypothetical protein